MDQVPIIWQLDLYNKEKLKAFGLDLIQLKMGINGIQKFLVLTRVCGVGHGFNVTNLDGYEYFQILLVLTRVEVCRIYIYSQTWSIMLN